MAVLVTADVTNQTPEGWDKALEFLGPAVKQAKGFIAVGAGMSREGWRVFELWESAADATAFFANHVRPGLPPDVQPHRSMVELHSLIIKP